MTSDAQLTLLVTDLPGLVALDRVDAGAGVPKLQGDIAEALFGGDWRSFALLDAAKIPHLPELLEAERIPAKCLFTGTAAEGYGDVAPWIAQLKGDERLVRQLFSKEPEVSALWPKSAAVFVRADASLDQVWSHYRRHIKVPRVGGPDIYFRFWDPEVAHFYYNGIADWTERVTSLCVSRHAVIGGIITPMPEDESARIFHLDRLVERSGDGPPLRLEERDLQVLAEMQWPKLERELTDWLPRADPVRFRGFDKDRRQRLSAHAIREGRAFGFTYKEEFAYFLYMMTFLGGWFHRVPQFSYFTRLLSDRSSDRYLKLRRDFPKVHAERFGQLGKPSEVMPYLKRRIDDRLAQAEGWSNLAADDVADLTGEIEKRLGWNDAEMSVVRAEADGQAGEIGLKSDLERELHYLLWLLVGPHYLTDPLFPWAGEVFAEAESPAQAIRDVARYAYRRLSRTLSIQRIMTRAEV